MNRVSWPILVAFFLLMPSRPTEGSYELVVNGGFETGNFSGWIAGPGNYVALEYGLDGGYGVKYGALGVASPLYQSIATTPGATYIFSFWQQTLAPGPSEFQAYWNGSLIFDLMDSPTSSVFTQHLFIEVATRTTTEIRFGLRQDASYSALDQVSVVPAAIVPEPSSLGMVGSALILASPVGFARWRSSRKLRRCSSTLDRPAPG